MDKFIEGVKIIGGIAGLLVLCWKIIEEIKGYLKIKIETSNYNNSYSVLTEIENTNKLFSKDILNTFLLIVPENYNLIYAGKEIAKKLVIKETIEHTNDFKYLKSDTPFYLDRQIGFIPLKFYYDENINIGDEKLTYRCSIDNTQLEDGKYSVRFYVFGKCRYLRSTQDLLMINK